MFHRAVSLSQHYDETSLLGPSRIILSHGHELDFVELEVFRNKQDAYDESTTGEASSNRIKLYNKIIQVYIMMMRSN